MNNLLTIHNWFITHCSSVVNRCTFSLTFLTSTLSSPSQRPPLHSWPGNSPLRVLYRALTPPVASCQLVPFTCGSKTRTSRNGIDSLRTENNGESKSKIRLASSFPQTRPSCISSSDENDTKGSTASYFWRGARLSPLSTLTGPRQ